jgi:hypothetical protein
MLKVTVPSKSTIKSHLPLFITKLDSDFSRMEFSAHLRINKERRGLPFDVPFRDIAAQYPNQQLIIEITPFYSGG